MRHKSENALAMATLHVRQSEDRVTRQRQVVEKLRADGHDTTSAENILATLEALLCLRVASVTCSRSIWRSRSRLRVIANPIEEKQHVAKGAMIHRRIVLMMFS
jgi:hypothetical protein